MSDIDTLSEYTIAPQHGGDLAVLDPYIIEDVAYSPNKCTYLCNYDPNVVVKCATCDWRTTVEQLPEDSGTVQPDCCPDCAKNGQLGWVRSDPTVCAETP